MHSASRSLTFKNKIALLLGVAVAGIALLTLGAAWVLRDQMIESRKNALAMAVQSQYSIAAAYAARADKGEMSIADAQKTALDALRVARFGGPDGKTNYFYIWSVDGLAVMHPFKPEWTGQSMIGKLLDPSGFDTVATMLTAAKTSPDGTAFVPMNFPRPNSTVPVPKVQYVRTLARGTG